jgi:hypothetical protein
MVVYHMTDLLETVDYFSTNLTCETTYCDFTET